MEWSRLAENISSKNLQNKTSLRQFHLEIFLISETELPAVFIGILLMYLLAVTGNLIIVTLVCSVSQLHKPMYFFLCNLSAQDIIYVSAFLPKLLAIMITGDTSISFLGCFTQIFMYGFCINSEFFLLSCMAYDRYVAICIPLRYSLIMNKKYCALLITLSWCNGFLNALIFTLMMSNLSYCNKHKINNIFCDSVILLKLSCSDITFIVTYYIPILGLLLGWLPFVLIFSSYIHIIMTILQIRTSVGRHKTFSSCSSHLTVVILFFGTCLGLNMKPKSDNSLQTDKFLSILYIGLVPLVNPLVYSLRNKDVLKAMKHFSKNIC